MMASRVIRWLPLLLAATALLLVSACSPSAPNLAELAPAGATGGRLWPTAGHDLSNTRDAKTERRITPGTAADLAVRWVVETGGDVSATPAVDGTSVYVPDWAGNLYRLDRVTGEVLWSRTIESYTGIVDDVSSTTPVVHDGLLILGSQGGTDGAHVFAVDKATGVPVWTTIVDPHPAAVVVQSAVVFDGKVFVGVASNEELLAAAVPSYPCCSFRGRMVALDVATGAVVWTTLMAPDGFAGNAISGSTPVVDPKRRQVYVTTDHNTAVPAHVLDCVAAAGGDTAAQGACLPADDLFDAIVALDLDTGAIRWATRALAYDAFTFACVFGSPDNCPSPNGPGHGFVQGAMLFRASADRGRPVELLGAGQQSGQFWALDPDTGQVVWVTQAGPGGVLGGLQGSSAVDGDRIYVANANAQAVAWTLPDGLNTTAGMWSAIDPATGELLWQVADPSEGTGPFALLGAVTAANGVVFGCSAAAVGPMYALDAATGTLLWSFQSGGSCAGGAAVVDGTVYWGSGFAAGGPLLGTTDNHRLYAFDLGD